MKNAPDRPIALPRTNKSLSAVPPCSRSYRAPLRDTAYPRQANACHTSQNTRQAAFDCALRGPFDDPYATRLSASRALCKIVIAFISASTVLMLHYSTRARACQGAFQFFRSKCGGFGLKAAAQLIRSAAPDQTASGTARRKSSFAPSEHRGFPSRRRFRHV